MLSSLEDKEEKKPIENKKETLEKSIGTKESLPKYEQKGVDNSITNLEVSIISNDHTNEIKIDFESRSECKKPLINNTIALSNNKAKKLVQDIFKDLDKYLANKKYNLAASILKDASIAAASDDHVLLTYKYIGMVESNDKEIEKITCLLCDALQCKCKVVAITDDDWKKERPYYVNLKKKNGEIALIEEIEENVGGGFKNEKLDPLEKEAIDIFGNDLIEME